jgi:hypothetical protein
MTISPKHLIRAVAAAGAVAAACAAAPPLSGSAAAPPEHRSHGRTETLRLYVATSTITLTRADGTVVRRPPYPEAGPGDVLDVTDRVFAGTHRRHRRRALGTDHLRCTFGSSGPPDCISHVAVGGSMLVFVGDPGTVLLGTGRWAGARGRVLVNREVPGGSDVVVRVIRR